MKRRTVMLTTILAMSCPALVTAGDRFPPETGTRVRLTAPRYFLYGEAGTVAGSDRFGMQVALDTEAETVDVAYYDVTRIDVSRGPTKLTFLGALSGAALGMVLGAVTTPMPHSDPADPFAEPRGGDPFGRMVVGAMLGGFAGGALGSTMTVERWEPVFTAYPGRHR